MNGILPLYKPTGMSSHDCVAAVRKIIHERRVGHSGTLDPQVDGVLPICIGQATKVVDYLLTKGKVYTGEILLGQASETEDLEGAIIAQTAIEQPFDPAQIKQAMADLTGDIIQIPPMYSAVKVNGRRLYDYARSGDPVQRPEHPVHIYRFQLLDTNYDATTKTQRIQFSAEVSKGTYIRTLAVDCGKILGVPALMAQLTRLSSGGFNLADTISLADFKAAVDKGEGAQHLFPMERVLSDFPVYALSPRQREQIQNGAFLELPGLPDVVALTYQNYIKALYQRKRGDVYKPLRMFLQNEGIGS
ncbi:MAG: tRNA pseudouridine(55) synthase TruB [Lactobacillus sp.]|jgi:tRNA pseudouridine55 synthase|nr:tRNA pseudouridine(55) synthase TruB [Lactobacillus sp.]